MRDAFGPSGHSSPRHAIPGEGRQPVLGDEHEGSALGRLPLGGRDLGRYLI